MKAARLRNAVMHYVGLNPGCLASRMGVELSKQLDAPADVVISCAERCVRKRTLMAMGPPGGRVRYWLHQDYMCMVHYNPNAVRRLN